MLAQEIERSNIYCNYINEVVGILISDRSDAQKVSEAMYCIIRCKVEQNELLFSHVDRQEIDVNVP
jgi:hypothetical protein